jgi:hypothetical protein
MSEQACPSCGAELRDARTCRHRLDVLLVKTFDVDAIHYALGVAAFVLQHARAFEPVEVKSAHLHLQWALEEGASLAEIEKRLRQRFGKKDTPAPSLPALPHEWSYTIDDLEDGDGDEERRVIAWARTVLRDVREATPQ